MHFQPYLIMMKKLFWICHVSIGMYICIHGWRCTLLEPEHSDRFLSYLVFESLSFLGLWPVNLVVPATKIRAHHVVPETQNDCILKKTD
jgi:hypothetical protein